MDHQIMLNEIAMARGKDFTTEQVITIEKALDRVDYREATNICRGIARAEKMPLNIYGAICNDVDSVIYNKNKQLEAAAWETANPAEHLTYGEYFWYFRIISNLIKLSSAGVIAKYPNTCKPMDIDEWRSARKPHTWCALLDNLLVGSIGPYFKTVENGANENGRTSLELYFAEQYSKLEEWKKEKGILI